MRSIYLSLREKSLGCKSVGVDLYQEMLHPKRTSDGRAHEEIACGHK